MTRDDAHQWLTDKLNVSRETLVNLDSFVDAVIAEAEHQNLVSAASIASMWERHVVDSAQLLLHAKAAADARPWIDLGTGAGFPGIVIALIDQRPIILVESRRKRFTFLEDCTRVFGLSHVTVHGGALETLSSQAAAVISARAFAPLPRLLDAALCHSRKDTVWLLPKGRKAAEELESVSRTWQGDFALVPSHTDAQAAIIVARGVHKRKVDQ